MEELNGWYPIETAPKDGTHIFVCIATKGDSMGLPLTLKEEGEIGNNGIFQQRAAWWNQDGWIVYSSMTEEPKLFFEPTHWRPLFPFPYEKVEKPNFMKEAYDIVQKTQNEDMPLEVLKDQAKEERRFQAALHFLGRMVFVDSTHGVAKTCIEDAVMLADAFMDELERPQGFGRPRERAIEVSKATAHPNALKTHFEEFTQEVIAIASHPAEVDVLKSQADDVNLFYDPQKRALIFKGTKGEYARIMAAKSL